MSKQVIFKTEPNGILTGSIRVTGDKSMSHRSIMLGSLAEGTTEVTGFLNGEDCLATIKAFRNMGVTINGPENGNVSIQGVGLNGLKAPADAIDMGNSGTAMRLLTGVMAGQLFDSVLIGDASLSTRPMRRITKPLTQMGATIETNEAGTPPLSIKGNRFIQDAQDFSGLKKLQTLRLDDCKRQMV